MAKEMTKEFAIEILKGSISHPRFEEAKRFLMDNFASDSEVARVLAAAEGKEYEAENNLSSDDVNVYEKNTEDLNKLGDEFKFDDLTKDEDVGAIVDQVNIFETVTDKDGNPIQTSEGPAEEMLSKEESRKYTSLIFDAATLKAKMHLTGDETFSKLDDETKAKRYKGLVNRIFFTDLAVTAVAGEIDTNLQPKIGTKEYEEYISKQAEQATTAFMEAADGGCPINIHAEHILASVADTAQKVETYADKLREKAKKLGGKARTKLNEISVGFNTRLNKLEDKADKFSKGKYRKYAKPVLTRMSDNRVQLVGNTATTMLLTAALVTPAAPVALGAYGVYFAATSWVYPITERARRNNRIRKEKGEEKLKFKDAWREAKDQLLAKTVKVTDKETGEIKEVENEERKKYIRRAAIKTGVALVGFGLLAKKIAQLEAARKAVSLTRMGVTNTAQATEVGIAGTAVLKNKSAKNKQDLTNASIGLGVGLATSALTQLLTGNTELFSQKGDEVADQIAQNGGIETLGDGADYAATDTLATAQADTTGFEGGTPAEDLAEVTTQAEFEPFPREWSEDLGLSRRQYNNLMSRLPGILKEVDENSPDRLYNNLNDEVMANFPGKTKMQVLYDIEELYRNGRRSQFVLGNAEHGFYINTPMGREPITDEGVIAAAKQALANGDKISVARLHGENFLVGQFHKMNIEGLDSDKMDAIVKIAMETYDPNEVKEAVAQIHEILPDLDKAQLATIAKIVDYNRQFEVNGKIMGDLLHMVACGEGNGNGAEMSDLVNKTQAILAQSHGDARPLGQEIDCGRDNVVHVHRTVKEVEVKVEEPTLPILEEPVIEEEPIVIPETKAPVLEDTMPKVKVAEYKAPEPKGRHIIAEGNQDYVSDARVQETVTNAKAAQNIGILNKKAGREK